MTGARNANPDDISRHDCWKAAYITFLAESPELAHEFFSSRPMEMRGHRYHGAALLEHLWSSKADISMDWNYAGVDALERFLIDHGRDPFEYRDFKRRFEISLGQKNANFEVRFARLAEKPDAEPGDVKIEKIGRGRFQLLIIGQVNLSEMSE